MIKHRRWFLSASAAAVISEIAGRFSAAKEALAAAPQSKPPQTPTKWTEGDLKKFFLVGHPDVKGGLNPPGQPALDDTVLGDRLIEHYRSRIQNPPSLDGWEWLPKQAAALGQLTRCMCLNVDKSSRGTLKVRHLEWAREALGFALNGNTAVTQHYSDSQHSPIPCGPIAIGAVKEADQPCALC